MKEVENNGSNAGLLKDAVGEQQEKLYLRRLDIGCRRVILIKIFATSNIFFFALETLKYDKPWKFP